MMKAKEIIVNLCNEVESSPNLTIWGVFSKVFDEKTEILLFKKRAKLIEHCERVLVSVEADKDMSRALFDICQALAYKNLGEQSNKIAPNLTKAHKSAATTLFRLYESIKKDNFNTKHFVQEIVELNKGLKESIKEAENLSDEEKEFLKSIVQAVEDSQKEYDLIGNDALKKLLEQLLGKFCIYKNVFKDIKDEGIKEKVNNLCNKVKETNEMMDVFISISHKVTNFLGYLGI